MKNDHLAALMKQQADKTKQQADMVKQLAALVTQQAALAKEMEEINESIKGLVRKSRLRRSLVLSRTRRKRFSTSPHQIMSSRNVAAR